MMNAARHNLPELLIFLLFCLILVICLVLGLSILFALLAGLVLFWVYALCRGVPLRELASVSLSGVKTVKSMLVTFLFIGVLTALWRASGCIPAIITYASGLIRPSVFVLLTFLLCSGLSFLTGTSFGTAATMGAVCVSLARAMGLPLFWVGGAVLSGAFFGDRCSPVSTSALLVCTLTDTDIYANLRRMAKAAAVPFGIACLVYLTAGFFLRGSAASADAAALFRGAFVISPVCLLPALAILIPAFFRVRVRVLMTASIAVAALIALLLQKMPAADLLRAAVLGYTAPTEELNALIGGGGLVSMLKTAAVVCLASTYPGIFRRTGLLDFMAGPVRHISKRRGSFAACTLLAAVTAAVSCSQALSIMLTDQLASVCEPDKARRALWLEDSSVVIAPLIPWSIAGAVPLASCGAPTVCLIAACYLWLIPLWGLIRRWKRL